MTEKNHSSLGEGKERAKRVASSPAQRPTC